MPAEIITIASLKSAVGKTTVTYALAAAGAATGLDVIALDLDPSGGISAGLEVARRETTIADVLEARIPLADALSRHPLGIRTLAAHRTLDGEALTAARLRAVLEPVLDRCDIVLLDTGFDETAVTGPLAVADRIVVPTSLDVLSMRAAALTAGLAQQEGCVERVSGLAVVNVPQPPSATTQSLLDALLRTGMAYESVLWHDQSWAVAAERTAPLPETVLASSKALLREVATRPAPVDALMQFIALAQGRLRKPAVVAAS